MGSELSATVAAARRDRGCDPCGLRDSGVARLCHARWSAAAIWHLLLSGRRPVLCAVRLVAPARDWSDFGDLNACRRHDRGYGTGQSGTLGRHCGADRISSGLHVRAGVAAAVEFAGQFHQRDHSARFQGRRGANDCHDPAAEIIRGQRRRRVLLRAHRHPLAARSPIPTSPC